MTKSLRADVANPNTSNLLPRCPDSASTSLQQDLSYSLCHANLSRNYLGVLEFKLRSDAPDILTISKDHIISGLDQRKLINADLERIYCLGFEDHFDAIFNIETQELVLWPKMRGAVDEHHRSSPEYKKSDKIRLGPGNKIFAIASLSNNAFAHKTYAEIREMLFAKGFRNPPKGSKCSFVVPEEQGRFYTHLWYDAGRETKEGVLREPAHVDLYYERNPEYKGRAPERPTLPTGEIFVSKKFPINPSDPDWARMRDDISRQQRVRDFAAERRDAKSLSPTMTHGGVELYLLPMDELEPQPHLSLLFPLDSQHSSFIDFELNQVIQDLFTGMYLCDEVPRMSLDPRADKSANVCLPSAYHATLVGHILTQVDALAKGVMMGTLLPRNTRDTLLQKFLQTDDQDNPFRKDLSIPSNSDELWQVYLRAGAENLRDDEIFGDQLRTCEAIQRLSGHHGGVQAALIVFSVVQKSLAQHGNHVLFDHDFKVMSKPTQAPRYARQQSAKAHLESTQKSLQESIYNVMTRHPECQHYLDLLKFTATMARVLQTLKSQNLMPDLSALDRIGLGCPHEDQVPPYPEVRRGDTDPLKIATLHGAIVPDVTPVQKVEMPGDIAQMLDAEATAGRLKTGKTLTLNGRRYLSVQLPVVAMDPETRQPAWLWQKRAEAARPTLADVGRLRDELHVQLQASLGDAAPSGKTDFDLFLGICVLGALPLFDILLELQSRSVLATMAHHPDYVGRTPMSCAIAYGHLPVVRKLIQWGAPVEGKGTDENEPPIVFAALLGHHDIVGAFNDVGVVLPPTHPMALHAATVLNDKDQVLNILQIQPQSILMRDRLGRTAMHHAALQANCEVVLALLRAGARIDARDNSEVTPLALLCNEAVPGEAGPLLCMQHLLDANADVCALDIEGQTPLHAMGLRNLATFYVEAWRRYPDEVAAGDKIANASGKTPAGLAALWDSLEFLQSREAAGLSCVGRSGNAGGLTLTHLAAKGGSTRTLKWLFDVAPESVHQQTDQGLRPHRYAYTPECRALIAAAAAKSSPVIEAPDEVPGLVDGWVTASNDDTDKFTGNLIAGIRHGWGDARWSGGMHYVGIWHAGVPEGSGTMTWPDGSTYAGDWQGGSMHGAGRHTWPGGSKYEGGWRRGRRTGQGSLTLANLKSARLSGAWLHDTLRAPYQVTFNDGFEYRVGEGLCPIMLPGPKDATFRSRPTSLAKAPDGVDCLAHLMNIKNLHPSNRAPRSTIGRLWSGEPCTSIWPNFIFSKPRLLKVRNHLSSFYHRPWTAWSYSEFSERIGFAEGLHLARTLDNAQQAKRWSMAAFESILGVSVTGAFLKMRADDLVRKLYKDAFYFQMLVNRIHDHCLRVKMRSVRDGVLPDTTYYNTQSNLCNRRLVGQHAFTLDSQRCIVDHQNIVESCKISLCILLFGTMTYELLIGSWARVQVRKREMGARLFIFGLSLYPLVKHSLDFSPKYGYRSDLDLGSVPLYEGKGYIAHYLPYPEDLSRIDLSFLGGSCRALTLNGADRWRVEGNTWACEPLNVIGYRPNHGIIPSCTQFAPLAALLGPVILSLGVRWAAEMAYIGVTVGLRRTRQHLRRT